MDYYNNLCEWLREVHELARQSLAEARVQQKKAYVLRTKEEDWCPSVGLQPSEVERMFPKARQPLGGALHCPRKTVGRCLQGAAGQEEQGGCAIP